MPVLPECWGLANTGTCCHSPPFQMEGSDITRTRELPLPAAKQFVCASWEWQHVRFVVGCAVIFVFFCHPWGHFGFCEALQGDESSVFAHIDTSSKKCSHSAMWAIISSQDSKTRKKRVLCERVPAFKTPKYSHHAALLESFFCPISQVTASLKR